MREIEIKARVLHERSLLQQLKHQGIILGRPLKQHDMVYSRPNAISGDPKEIWLRVRIENGKTTYFTLKRAMTSELDSIEHEVTVSNRQELIGIIKELGFVPFSDIYKIRRTGKYGQWDICLDRIDGLGTFIEVEQLCDTRSNPREVSMRLWTFLNALGVQNDQEVHQGYDVLLRQLSGK